MRLALLFSVLSVVAVAGCGAPKAPAATGHAAALDLPSSDGSLVHVPITGARVTVLDAFGPTCAPCKESVPALVAKQSSLETNGAKLVLVAVLADGESTDDAKKALASWGVKSPFLIDRGGALGRELGVKTLPATLVLDSEGHVVWTAAPGASVDSVVAATAPSN